MKPDRSAKTALKRSSPLDDVPRFLRCLPELKLLASNADHVQALAAVAEGLPRKWLLYLLALGVVTAIVSLTYGVFALLKRLGLWDFSGPVQLAICVAVPQLIAWPGAAWLFARVHRKRAQRLLREYLVGQGVAVCLHCGYDLRGQTVARCPECGRTFDPALLKADPTAQETHGAEAAQ